MSPKHCKIKTMKNRTSILAACRRIAGIAILTSTLASGQWSSSSSWNSSSWWWGGQSWWQQRQNIVETLQSKSQYSTLVTAVEAAGLTETLAEADSITIFAPTNEAFAKIPEETLSALLADKDALTKLLTYHVLPQELKSFRLRDGDLETLEGSTVAISRERFRASRYYSYTRLKVNDATIVSTNLAASNGIIHGIDSVLSADFEPPKTILDLALKSEILSTLTELVQEARYDRALDSSRLKLTVFAPTNEAFAALPEETLKAVLNDRRLLRSVLRNHIFYGAIGSADLSTGVVRPLSRKELNVTVSDDGIVIQGANVIAADIEAVNGVVHVVDKVLIPEEQLTLIGVANSRDDLSTFKAALDAAGYTRFLDRERSWWKFTLFAPNNEAFSVIPPEDLGALLEDQRTLRSILNRHLSFRQILSSDLSDGDALRTFGDPLVKVEIAESGVFLNGAQVVAADLRASNGVIHVIDSILPEEAPAPEEQEEEPENTED